MSEFEKITTVTKEALRTSLARTGSRAYAAFQYGMDTSLFLLSGSMLANEKDFLQLRSSVRFTPSESSSLSFERAKFESQRWLLKNSLQDGLRLTTGILENVRTICALAGHVDKTDDELQAALKEVTGKSRAAFARLSLIARLDRLKEDFGIECPHRAELVSLLKLADCLQSRGGVVTKADADQGKEMIVHLYGIKLSRQDAPKGDGEKEESEKIAQMQVKRAIKRIPVGQPIEFSRGEHMAAILTLCIFTGTLLQEIDKFLKSAAPCAEVVSE